MAGVTFYIAHYGYAAMYFLLALGILGIPVPDETLIVAFGGMAARGEFNFAGALAVTFLGSMTGMLISYSLGRMVGEPLLHRYGKWVRMTPERLAGAEKWFRRYGSLSIIVGYFVPGLRHLSSYIAGTTKLPARAYVVYAGAGAALWCTTFMLIGHAVGYHWNELAGRMTHTTIRIGLLAALLALGAVIGLLRWKKR
ncbi:DedA family protein [Paenibacillus sp. S28]|uniref:DedA family protein n=1 Tax=Paenibacillus sp. S28 TaxID=2767463 RepID=UPI00190A6AEE|nr:DedA family protein [Paenibacillus sp. S28]MBJ9989124.1 DedA family protein [Paenibacillus sp. S28]